jgi:CHAD domain-containing protein
MAKDKETCVNPEQTVEQAFEGILRSTLAVAREWEPVALAREDPEGVHQMRVCLRRMRSALVLFGPAIPRRLTRSFFQETRWAAKTLDHARDLDVYIDENLSSKGKKRKAKMRRLAMKQRERAYDKVADFIEGGRYRKMCDEFRQWVETQGWRMDLSDGQRDVLAGNVIPFASNVLDRQRARVLEAGRDIETLENEALHQLRIDCKKLRYGAEFFAPLYGERMKAFVHHLKDLQDLLGNLHDTAVMRDLQKDLLNRKKNRRLKRYARNLLQARGEQARAVTGALRERWEGFSNAERPWAEAGA